MFRSPWFLTVDEYPLFLLTPNQTALCQDITVDIDSSGADIDIDESNIDNGSDDACGFTLAASATLGCDDVGDNTVTLLVTDDSGLTDSCDSTVTVQDSLPPVSLR